MERPDSNTRLHSAVIHRYTLGEEIANSITHGIGAALSIAALVLLVVFASQHRDAWRIVSFSIYGVSLITLYLSSTLYHAFTNEKAKHFFRLMDHSCIFLLIAGTYTPPTLIAMRGSWGWTLFTLIWAMAVGGLIFETINIGKYKFISVAIYMAMGWLAIVAIKPMLEALPPGMFQWFLIGGLFYTAGIIFYAWKRIPYNHAIWHLFVLGGSITHFFGILFYLALQPA
ncbi:MAG: hemolysin III family protein [Desulfobacteraceae bacterium]|nr:hemolysin III family protein [Desulfobacteraceae bacterium]MBC2757269.1 hemolysin III family protein [Desulfobacteraceae bacterium]